MASAESTRIKVRSRRLISELRKSTSTSVKNSRFSEQKSDVTCLNEIHERPLNLAADIVEQMNSRPAASATEPSKFPSCTSLSSCYHPTELRHFDEFGRRRRRTTQPPTVLSCYRKAHIKGGARTGTLESSRVTPTSSQTPGRISRLAGRVESLELHDLLHTSQSVPIDGPSSATVNLLSSQQLSKPTKPGLDGENSSSPPESPWYRHCRPSAPKPYCTPSCSRSDDSSTETIPTRKSAGDQLSAEPREERAVVKLTQPVNIFSSLPPEKLDLPALELDVDQENRCMESDFPLPPVPIPTSFEAYLEDTRWTDHPFPSPPPQLTTPAMDTWFPPTDTQLTTTTTSLGPLTPITNILPNPVISGSRQPKWLTTSQARHRIGGLQQTLLFSGQTDFASRVSSLPSPPPVIIECIPDLPGRRMLDTPEDDDSRHLLEHTLPLTNLARPTVLKRGPPDGAEQDTSSKSFELEAKKLENDSVFIDDAKRFFTPFDTGTYSPKKSRTRLLVPSEHSAFLPVGSTPALCRRVSSPCVH